MLRKKNIELNTYPVPHERGEIGVCVDQTRTTGNASNYAPNTSDGVPCRTPYLRQMQAEQLAIDPYRVRWHYHFTGRPRATTTE